MKRLLCLLLTLLTLAAVLTAYPASAADDPQVLTVTDEGRVLAEVEVGNQFIYNVGLFTDSYSVTNGQGELRYDGDYVKLVAYGPLYRDGSANVNAYSFAERVNNSSLVANYDIANRVYYNFAKGTPGIGSFGVSDHYFKIRFQAIAPGTVEIRHIMTNLATRVNGEPLRLFNLGIPNRQLDPVPYTLSSAEPAVAFIGDADGDYELSVMDATFIQYLTAGRAADYSMTNTDVNTDGAVNLRDALQILRYKAGMATDTSVGEWIFESEQAAE